MSTLKVNNIDTQTGTTISVASGKVLTQPGSVIQTGNRKNCRSKWSC